MRLRPFALLAVLTILVGTACTSDAKPSTSPASSSGGGDCDVKGITSGDRREGECTAKGVAVSVVDKASTLHGKEYDAHVESVDTNGTIVTISLRVKNTLSSAHDFDRRSDLAFLLVDDQYFGERPDLETDPATSFRLRATDVPPGETVTGTVVFGLPPDQVARLSSEGSNLVLVTFSDEAKGFPSGSQPLSALGYIRLWK